jgi:hypothetical protein
MSIREIGSRNTVHLFYIFGGLVPGTKLGTVIGIALILVGVGMLAWSAVKMFRTLRTRHIGDRLQALYMMVVALYPLGNGFKFAIWGPEFFRFHLTDIGFPAWLGFVLFLHGTIHDRLADKSTSDVTIEETISLLRYRRKLLIAGLVMSYAYEIITGVMYWVRSDLPAKYVGSFDLVDMVMYTLGAALGFAVLAYWLRKALVVKASLDAMEQVAQTQERPLRRRTQPRRTTRSDRRR